MIKKLIFHLLIGAGIFAIGGSLHDFAKMKELGNLLAYGGMIYAALAAFIIICVVNMPPFLRKASEDIARKKAQDELLTYKKLFDEGILSKEEFDTKASELKKVIL